MESQYLSIHSFYRPWVVPFHPSRINNEVYSKVQLTSTLFKWTVTYSSRSDRWWVCIKPRTWKNSWTASIWKGRSSANKMVFLLHTTMIATGCLTDETVTKALTDKSWRKAFCHKHSTCTKRQHMHPLDRSLPRDSLAKDAQSVHPIGTSQPHYCILSPWLSEPYFIGFKTKRPTLRTWCLLSSSTNCMQLTSEIRFIASRV